MELMLCKAEKWAEEYNVTFSTDPDPKRSKSNLIHMVGLHTNLPKPAPISLCGQTLP